MNAIEIRDTNIDKNEILNRITLRANDIEVPNYATIGPENLQVPTIEKDRVQTEESGNHGALIDLMLLHQLEEPGFESNAPIIGPLIVKMRRFWNWMSTKWYVRPIIKQQSSVNGQIALLLFEMETKIHHKNQVITDLEKKVSQLEAAMAANNPNKQ